MTTPLWSLAWGREETPGDAGLRHQGSLCNTHLRAPGLPVPDDPAVPSQPQSWVWQPWSSPASGHRTSPSAGDTRPWQIPEDPPHVGCDSGLQDGSLPNLFSSRCLCSAHTQKLVERGPEPDPCLPSSSKEDAEVSIENSPQCALKSGPPGLPSNPETSGPVEMTESSGWARVPWEARPARGMW